MARLQPNGTTAPHASYSRYTNSGCRCGPCRAANTDYIRSVRRANRESRLESTVNPYVVEGIKHGLTGYNMYSCRCEVCVQANRTKPRSSASPHGSLSRYVNGYCRCGPCRAANTEHSRRRRAGV